MNQLNHGQPMRPITAAAFLLSLQQSGRPTSKPANHVAKSADFSRNHFRQHIYVLTRIGGADKVTYFLTRWPILLNAQRIERLRAWILTTATNTRRKWTNEYETLVWSHCRSYGAPVWSFLCSQNNWLIWAQKVVYTQYIIMILHIKNYIRKIRQS